MNVPVLFEAPEFMVIYYSSRGKLIQGLRYVFFSLSFYKRTQLYITSSLNIYVMRTPFAPKFFLPM